MYGPSGKEWGCFIVSIAVIGGALCIGLEHGVSWLWHHLSVGFR